MSSEESEREREANDQRAERQARHSEQMERFIPKRQGEEFAIEASILSLSVRISSHASIPSDILLASASETIRYDTRSRSNN